MEQCLKLGFTLFQGYYFAKPTIIAGKKLDHSQLSLMKLMGLLLSDAETTELEAALKPEPGLTVNLLRMTNSVGAGCTEKSPRSATPLPCSAAASCNAGCNCWSFPQAARTVPATRC
jgi:c-di-GMP-related signal transduction protein